MPLAAMLLGLSLLAHLFACFGDGEPRQIILVGAPLLFAIGAGALLIGQEKEQRTLGWLRTLPIAAGAIVRVKLLVGIAALAGMCLISYLMFAAFHQFDSASSVSAGWRLPVYTSTPVLAGVLCQLVFMLLAGYYLAWRFESSLLALGLLVPISIIPIKLVDFVWPKAEWERWFAIPATIAAMVAMIAAWRAGIRYLSPEAPGFGWGPSKRTSADARVERTWGAPQARASALLWQFGRQSWMLLAASVAAIAGAALWAVYGSDSPESAFTGVALLLTGTSWLGAGAFVGDHLKGRIRFLADRGVSPTLVWVTRHALPCCLLLTAGLLVPWSIARSQTGVGQVTTMTMAVAFFVAMLAIVYSASQWIGQLIGSPIVAAIAAPVVAWLAVWAATHGGWMFGAPIWLVAIASLLPLVTTWALMSKWMDGRLDVAYWLAHASALALIIALMISPTVIAWFEPGMPRNVAAEIKQLPPLAVPLTELTTPSIEPGSSEREEATSATGGDPDLGSAVGDQEQPEVGYAELPLALIETYREQLRGAQAITSNPRVVGYLVAEATKARWATSQDGDAREVYAGALECLVICAEKLRANPRLLEQDESALLERWLAEELRRPESAELLGDNLRGEIEALLNDDEGRRLARQRAVAAAWQAWSRNGRPRRRPQSPSDWTQLSVDTEVGGYWLGSQLPMSRLYDQIKTRRRIGQGLGFALADRTDPIAGPRRLKRHSWRHFSTPRTRPRRCITLTCTFSAMGQRGGHIAPGFTWQDGWLLDRTAPQANSPMGSETLSSDTPDSASTQEAENDD